MKITSKIYLVAMTLALLAPSLAHAGDRNIEVRFKHNQSMIVQAATMKQLTGLTTQRNYQALVRREVSKDRRVQVSENSANTATNAQK